MTLDLKGKRFGRLFAVEATSRDKGGLKWRFHCDCGRDCINYGHKAVSGAVRSCGCLIVDTARERATKHGHGTKGKETRTYKTWAHAKSRCYDLNDRVYHRYGGRGITMCDRWRNDFSAFLADMGEAPPSLWLERIDNDGNYEPGNCKWATRAEQVLNKSTTRKVIYEGELMSLPTYAKRIGISYRRLSYHMRQHGLDVRTATRKLARSDKQFAGTPTAV